MKRLIDFYMNTNHYINDAIDRIIVEIHLKKKSDGDKKFILSGCEPGVGATTIAINLAISMANAGWKTILIDGDLRKIAKFKRLNERLEVGLSDYLSGEGLYPQTVYDTNLKNLFYIPSGNKTTNPVSLLCSDKVSELMDQLSKDYDFIVMDMPSLTASVDANVMASKMDGVILVSEYARTDIRSIRKAKDILGSSGGKITGIILNKIYNNEYGNIVKNYDYYKNQRYANRQAKIKSKMIV